MQGRIRTSGGGGGGNIPPWPQYPSFHYDFRVYYIYLSFVHLILSLKQEAFRVQKKVPMLGNYTTIPHTFRRP